MLSIYVIIALLKQFKEDLVMKEITQQDIQTIKEELALKRQELDKLNLTLNEKLTWMQKFFNEYVPELEKRYMSEEELKEGKFLPNELRIEFYLCFPEHGLNMANYSQELAIELNGKNNFYNNMMIALRHQD